MTDEEKVRIDRLEQVCLALAQEIDELKSKAMDVDRDGKSTDETERDVKALLETGVPRLPGWLERYR